MANGDNSREAGMLLDRFDGLMVRAKTGLGAEKAAAR